MVAAGGFALVNWLTKRGGATANNPKTTQPAGAPGKGKKAVKQKNASTKAKRVTDQRQEAAQGTSQAEEPAPEPVEPDTFELFCSAVTLAPSIPTDGPTPPQPLAGLRVAVSEDLGLAGAQTSYGTPEAVMQDASTSSTCGAVSRLVSAGAAIIGKTSMQPLGTDLLGTNYGNPYNKAKISGGGHTGASMSVALGMANLALCTDMAGEARVAAACSGLYCYRSSASLGGGSAASSPGSVEALSVMGVDLPQLLQAAEVLGAPGSASLRGEIIKFVVAEDLFAMCAVEYQPACHALKKAILRWAGSEQAGAVQLCKFMADNSRAWRSLAVPEPVPSPRTPPGLDAQRQALMLLRAACLHERLPQLAGSSASEAQALLSDGAASSAADASDAAAPVSGEPSRTSASTGSAGPVPAVSADSGEAESGAAEGPASQPYTSAPEPASSAAEPASAPTDTAAGAAPAQPQLQPQPQGAAPLLPVPDASAVAVARELARELHEVFKATVKPDTVIVVPVVPTAPLSRTSPAPAAEAFAQISQAFAALPSLAQCPCVVVPLGAVADGTPLAVALMGVHKFDMRLLAVAAKMAPLMQASFEEVKRSFVEAAIKQQREAAAASSSGGGGTGAGGPAAGAASTSAAAPSQHAAAAGWRRGGGSSGGGGGGGGSPTHAAATGGGASTASPSSPPQHTPAPDPKRLERAERHKTKGNELFKAGKYAESIAEYTRAISELPDMAVYYNNRALAALKLLRFEQAEDDCNRALRFPELKEADKVKALLRRATARVALQKHSEAEKDLRQVLALEPNNKQAREELQSIRQMREEMAAVQANMLRDYQAQMMAAAAGGRPGAGSSAGGGMDPNAGMMGMTPDAMLDMLPGGYSRLGS